MARSAPSRAPEQSRIHAFGVGFLTSLVTTMLDRDWPHGLTEYTAGFLFGILYCQIRKTEVLGSSLDGAAFLLTFLWILFVNPRLGKSSPSRRESKSLAYHLQSSS